LCKRSRTSFSLLDDCAKFGVVWPVLAAKVGELGLGKGAAQALERWRCDVVSMPQVAGRPLTVQLLNRNLSKELNALRIADLCVRPILPDGVVERTDRLLVELRTLASVACKLKIMIEPPNLVACTPKMIEPTDFDRDKTHDATAMDV